MLKKNILYLMFFSVLVGYSQKNIESRKGNVYFDTGLEYRITPYYPGSSFFVTKNLQAIFVDTDLQNAGLGLNLGVEYFLGNNLSLKLSNTFRYDYIVSGEPSSGPNVSAAANTYGLLIDYNLSLQYYFKVFNKGDIFLSAGISRANTNSDFALKETFFNSDGIEIGTIVSTANNSFWANRFELGYSSKKSSIGLGVLMSSGTNYFDERTLFTVPFVKLNIKLGRL